MDVYGSAVKRAMEYAQMAHKDQKYGDGDYYTNHILPVVEMTFALGGDDIHMIVACLHDGIEDKRMTVQGILDKFGLAVLTHVLALTKQEGETYPQYVRRASRDPVALIVKLADLSCNLKNCVATGAKEDNILKYRDALKILRRKIDKSVRF